ncbi:unnamed protein product [Arabis nemorensis]|uniref:Uncharacterized protein n=1 Tax=Arabis nemorensis TaxID=586526 RepID=A0A565C5D7_9BRAS|nr:unnamed protein product [Arabis nemorensis]
MVDHASNPISTFLEKVVKQEGGSQHQKKIKKLENLQESSKDEAEIPDFLMAEQTVKEEDIESDGGNISEDRQEPRGAQPPPDGSPRTYTESHPGFSFDNISPAK